METQQSPKIRFYVQRSFGEKMNASFDFIKENWKTVFKYTTYLLLPVCLVQGLSLNSFMGYYVGAVMGEMSGYPFDNFDAEFWLVYGLILFFSIIGYLLMSSLIITLMKLYNEREERLNGINFSMLRPVLLKNMGRIFLQGILLMLLALLIMGVVVLLAMVTPFTLMLTLPGVIALFIALSIWLPVYLFEDIKIGASFTKALRLGFATWGGIFAILFIMGIIASVLQGVVMTPYYIAVFVKALFVYSSDSGASEPSFLYNLFTYVLGVLFVFGAYLSYIFSVLGLSYQYAHASEKMDSITVEDDIDNFENL